MHILITIILVIAALAVGFLAGRQSLANALAEAKVAEAKALAAIKALTDRNNETTRTYEERIHEEREARSMEMRREREMMREEIKALAEEVARRGSDRLRNTNREEMDRLLTPLGESIKNFQNTFIESNATVNTRISEMLKSSLAMNREAEELTKALRATSKTQGNWGEGVLRNILEMSGLTAGRDFEEQMAVSTEDGRRLFPDVVVHLPDDRHVVIDSKVSLTAFVDYTAAPEEKDRATALRQHIDSIRRHIKELSEKDYPKFVHGAIGYVLMFIPSEAAYVAAVEGEPRLAPEAYARGVILLNPSNLLMALQLAYNLWQSERRSQSVSEIYDSAMKVYDKFVTFAETFERIGESIERLQMTYDKARGQLSTGRGNVIRRLEMWKKKGLTPKNKIPDSLLQADKQLYDNESGDNGEIEEYDEE